MSRSILACVSLLGVAVTMLAISTTPTAAADTLPQTEADPARQIHCPPSDLECRAFAGTLPAALQVTYPLQNDTSPDQRQTFFYKGVPFQLSDWEAEQARRCLVLAAYSEAAVDDYDGMLAVVHVVMNRVVHPRFSGSICENVVRPHAFEAVRSKHPFLASVRQIRRGLMPDKLVAKSELEARRLFTASVIAFMVLAGYDLPDTTNDATHYWAPEVQERLQRDPPFWNDEFVVTAMIGGHQFHREPD